MTISTALGNTPWAAPVYYVHRNFNFFFFSDPNSRHIREAIESEKASAAIFHPASTWKEIRGIQMSGSITHLSPGLEAIRAIRSYLQKFPFTGDFFDSANAINLEAFVKRFHVRLYVFRPALLYYQDNSIRFGFREEIKVA